jgi:hypothetical protein
MLALKLKFIKGLPLRSLFSFAEWQIHMKKHTGSLSPHKFSSLEERKTLNPDAFSAESHL